MSDIEIERDDSVLIVRLNRPERLNAFSQDMLEGLTGAIKSARVDSSIRAIVLTGAGRSFCAGGDVSTMGDAHPDEVYAHINLLIEAIAVMTHVDKPIVAAVHGAAAGAGFNLVLASDLVVASDDAKFVMSFGQVGLISDGGGLWFLPRLIGPHRAKELFFLSEPIDAKTARDWGIVNRVVGLDDLQDEALKLARTLARQPRRVLAQSKRLIQQATSMSLIDLMRQEQITQTALANSADHREGVNAFMEKRAARFKD